jgi:hypothetical protein
MSRDSWRVARLLPLAALLACSPLMAQEGGDQPASSTGALQKATQNPVADLISVPIQDNLALGIGPHNRSQNVINIQPVVPFHLTQDWNLITRTILPIVYQPDQNTASLGTFGLSDLNPSLFLTPAHPGAVIWGVGPALVFPTATDPSLGQGKWSAGPSFVVLAQPGHWTLGLLANNVWSFAGQADRASVNQFLAQYFINYNLSKGWYVTSAPIITANWVASRAKDVWTVPFGAGVGRIMKVGFQPINLQLSAFANAAYPSGSSPWGIRLQIAFLFPVLSTKEKELLLEQKLQEMREQQSQGK